MNPLLTPSEEFEQLLAGVMDGPPEALRHQRLSELLRLYPALQDDYLDYMQLHALLIWREGRAIPEAELERGRFSTVEVAGTPLSQLAERKSRTRSRWIAAAAVACVATALGLLLNLLLAPAGDPEKGPEVVERLVGWNLDIAQAETPSERHFLHDSQAETMQGLLRTSGLAQEDRELGETLVENGAWLAGNDDPVSEAERFGHIADKLLARLDSASGARNNKQLARYAESYSRLTELGVSVNLERAIASSKNSHDAKRRHKIDFVIAADAGRARKLEDMLDRHPDASLKAINRARKAHNKKFNAPTKQQP